MKQTPYLGCTDAEKGIVLLSTGKFRNVEAPPLLRTHQVHSEPTQPGRGRLWELDDFPESPDQRGLEASAPAETALEGRAGPLQYIPCSACRNRELSSGMTADSVSGRLTATGG